MCETMVFLFFVGCIICGLLRFLKADMEGKHLNSM